MNFKENFRKTKIFDFIFWNILFNQELEKTENKIMGDFRNFEIILKKIYRY